MIGAGASGLACAIAAAEAGAKTVALERDAECGRSILATGNGRCNLANANLAWARYNDPAFVGAVCGDTFENDVLAFFEESGLAVVQEEDGRLYPLSRQAASVRDVLLARAERADVTLAAAREVTGIAREGKLWRVSWSENFDYGREGALLADTIVIACGGSAGRGEASRRSASLLESLGIEMRPWTPVLCPLACEPVAREISLEELDGRRAHVTARLLRNGREIARERGEVLFRPWGLSGIVTFDLSREAREGDVISLDLTDGLDAERASELARAAGGLAGIIDPVIANVLQTAVPIISAALDTARDLRLIVHGPTEVEHAQVMRGGLLTNQFETATLEARKLPGLFACGEALDVDGACGGFNLAWAWKSGLVAGSAAAARAACS